MKRVLITGSNRGLGLALAGESLDRGYRVFATCRRPDEAQELRRLQDRNPDLVTILRLDVTDEESIQGAVDAVAVQVDGLDLLINNAGINPDEYLGGLAADTMLHTYHVNSVGPILVAQAYLDLLRAADDARVLNISSTSGSLAQKSSGGGYSYSSSKSALNMLTRALAFDLRSVGIVVIAIHPGWVRTDMGGASAPLSPAASARGILDVADDVDGEDTGSFLRHDGRGAPW